MYIFEINLLEYHTGHKVPVKIYMKIIIRWCTVPVEICAALLFMWRCRFCFGDCLPLSLALHHFPTTINRATTTPIFAKQRISTTVLPPSRCAPPPPPLTLPPSCHQHRAVALPPPPRRRQAAANVALSRCRHRRSCRAAATVLPPLRCAPLPRCRQPRAVALLPTSRCRAVAAAAPPFVGWLLRCCPPSDVVITCHHVTLSLPAAFANK
jgi:hypothetical protein